MTSAALAPAALIERDLHTAAFAVFATLAPHARAEVDIRVAAYPAMVRADRVTAELATLDTQIWHLIALGFEHAPDTGGRFVLGGGVQRMHDMNWADVRAALDRSDRSRQRAADLAPDDEAVTTRRNHCSRITAIVRRHVDLFERLNAELTARADATRATTRQAA